MTQFFDIENLAPWHYLTPPIPDTANAVSVNINPGAGGGVVLTPGAGVNRVVVAADRNLRINPNGAVAVDNDTCLFAPAFQGFDFAVTPGVAVYALALGGTATVLAAPLVRNRIVGKALAAFINPRVDVRAAATAVTP